MTHGRAPGLGIILVLLMGACFATMDTTVKLVGAVLPVLVILWARYGVQAASMGVWLVVSRHRGGAGFRSAHPRFQLARGVLLLVSSAFGYFGLQYVPVAEFTAIVMLTPMLVTLMSGWLLHERISALRWALVGGGLAGALVVIRPGSGIFGWAVLLPLASALAYASFQVLTRKLAGLESPYTTHFYTGLVGTAIVVVLLLVSPVELAPELRSATPAQWAMLFAIGALGTAGHLMLVLAFGLAPTATLMPLLYAQIGFAAIASWVVFEHAPDLHGWIGMGMIGACGAASAWLNVREAAATRTPITTLSADPIAD